MLRGSIADKAGLRANDLIVDVNGKQIFNLDEIVPFLKENAGGKVTFTVNRGGQTLPIELPVPPVTETNPMRRWTLGIDWGASFSTILPPGHRSKMRPRASFAWSARCSRQNRT